VPSHFSPCLRFIPNSEIWESSSSRTRMELRWSPHLFVRFQFFQSRILVSRNLVYRLLNPLRFQGIEDEDEFLSRGR
jgi:hypothetical protein